MCCVVIDGDARSGQRQQQRCTMGGQRGQSSTEGVVWPTQSSPTKLPAAVRDSERGAIDFQVVCFGLLDLVPLLQQLSGPVVLWRVLADLHE